MGYILGHYTNLNDGLQYYLGTQLIAFIVIAPYMAISRWAPVFASQIRPLNSTWFVRIHFLPELWTHIRSYH